MEIKTQYFGSIPYYEEELIHFSDGLFGFSELKKYVPLAFQDNSDSLISLQSVDDFRISFILMNPFQLYPEYAPVLSAEDSKLLKATYDENNISYYVICVIHEHMDENTVNLKAPIAVNTDTREAKQIILDNPLYKFRHPIKDFIKRGK
ncbi:flagellar assembly factor FliW [Lacrimispora amygdalina]|uniref:Flagellar assembly factor FliW n=1 Tax=Lacrimispora amygdalina TaxID=253257 RepID=A0ABQ5M2F9_9FIRM